MIQGRIILYALCIMKPRLRIVIFLPVQKCNRKRDIIPLQNYIWKNRVIFCYTNITLHYIIF